jgi:hypothetical protein
VIKQHKVRFRRSSDPGNLLYLARANQRRGIRPGAPLHHLGSYYAARARYKLTKFRERLVRIQSCRIA